MKVQSFLEKDKIKSIETISSKVSNKYIPILSSNIVDILSPEFIFIDCTRFTPSNSQHQIRLKFREDIISIINSYDGSKAFRMYLSSKNIQIPLNIDRQVHIGQYASSMEDSIKLNKQNLIDSIQLAHQVVDKLKNTPVHKSFEDQLLDVIFYSIKKRDGFQKISITQYGSHFNNMYDYINFYTSEYLSGNYVVSFIKRGKDSFRKGRPIKSSFRKLAVMNDVYKYVIKNLPQISL